MIDYFSVVLLMTLQLSDSNKQSNYYLEQIDKLANSVGSTVQTAVNSVVSTAKTDIKSELLIKTNRDELNVPYSFFNDDVVAYYDFSSAKNLGKDFSGKGNHLANEGVSQTLGIDGRKFSAFFDRNNHTDYSNVPYSNQRVLTKLTNVNDFKMTEYTISLWFKEQVPGGISSSMFCVADLDSPAVEGTYVDMRTSNNDARFVYVVNGIVIIDIRQATTADAWHHFAVTMSPTGNKMYLDGTLCTTYTTGNTSMYVNLATLNIDNISVGAVHGNVASYNYDVGHRYRFPYVGYLSDIMVYKRALHADEITKLRNDHIGYAVVVLAGQSNCCGRDTIEVGVDDDYSLLAGRVDMFTTEPNINQTTYALNSSTITTAVNPMPHPDLTTNATNNGFWRTFANDLVQYADMPYRMKVLIVPTAKGGSGFSTSDWNVGNKYYSIALKAMQAVLDKDINPVNKMNKCVAFLWHQGESDITGLNTDYITNFNSMMNGFSANLPTGSFDLNKVAVIVAQISAQYTTVKTTVTPNILMKQFINTCLQTIADSKPNYGIVRGDDLKNITDFIHLTKESQRIIGRRYYDKMVSALNMNSRKAISNEQVVINEKEGALAVNANVTFGKGLSVVPVTSAGKTNQVLDTYFSCTKTYNCTGAYTGTIDIKFVRHGKMVFVTVPPTTATMVATNGINMVSQGDPLLLPTYDQIHTAGYAVGTTGKACTWYFQSNGNINIKDGVTIASAGNTFTNADVVSFHGFTACYIAQ
jgi:hypothetical protein